MENNVWGARLLHGSIGAVLGIGLAVFLGFGSGWITTQARLDAAVTEAQVAAYGAVCADGAVVAWRDDKRDAALLRKIDAWDMREKLAREHVGDLPLASDSDLKERVTRRCASDLMAAASDVPAATMLR